MKKIVVMILISLLFFSYSCAQSESVDLGQMSYEELIDLRFKIDEEIYKRDSEGDSLLYSGMYEVGSEIEPGGYLLRCIEQDTIVKCFVGIIDVETDEYIYQYTLKKDDITKVILPEGSLLEVYGGIVDSVKR